MSPDESALLASIFAAPDDDTPRLVYADWLDEQGGEADAARAEFIRLQCDRAPRAGTDPAARGIGRREYDLLAEWGSLWRGELPEGLRNGIVFRRGFAERLRCNAAPLFRAWRDGRLLPPIERLEITITDVSLDWLDVTRPPRMPPLRDLTLRCESPVGEQAIRLLTRQGPHTRLRSLTIRDPLMGDAALESLTPLPAFPNLVHLDLERCGIGDAGGETLLDSPWMGQLKHLVLTGNPISESTVRRLAARFGGILESDFRLHMD